MAVGTSWGGLSANSTASHIHGPSGPFPSSAGVLYPLNPTYTTVGVIILHIPTDGRYAGPEWQINPVNIVSSGLLPRGEAGPPGIVLDLVAADPADPEVTRVGMPEIPA